MTLYEIEKSILDCIDAETGEIIDFLRLEQLSLDRQTKIDNIASWYKQLTAETAAIDAEIRALSERKNSKQIKADSLKLYLSDILSGVKFETSRNKISWRVSDEVTILDETVIPDEYKRTVAETKVSKSDIKSAIKAGKYVVGAELIYKNNIQIK
jgi:hypothetical protein